MDDVVPSALLRLRAADIVRMAGLTAASLGQEYCRIGAVHSTRREGGRLFGIVDASQQGGGLPSGSLVSTHGTSQAESESAGAAMHAESEAAKTALLAERHHYPVEVEFHSTTHWSSTCSCIVDTPTLCSHAAALLYGWLARPLAFATSSSLAGRYEMEPLSFPEEKHNAVNPLKSARSARPPGPGRALSMRGPTPLGSLTDMLAQLGLTEMRSMAREHELSTAGLNKQQLAEALLQVLKQPEAARRVAATLEKPQRQLLATIILAGGAITDDDLRGLFERFAFGAVDKLHDILAVLQNKGLLFRASLNSSPQQRIGLSGALVEIGWFVPFEVRSALRATVPVVPFDIDKVPEGKEHAPTVLYAEPYGLLADALLVARALDGYQFDPAAVGHEGGEVARAPADSLPVHAPGTFLTDGTGTSIVPAPGNMPSVALLTYLESLVARAPAFLRFVYGLLRLADLLHKDDTGSPHLRLLPNAAQLLLGPTSLEVARDLFDLWLTQQSYEELFELQEEGLKLRSRTTTLNHPVLRVGELELENSEARQSLLALIAQAPRNQWIHFTAFARFVYRLHPLFLQRRQRLFPAPHWWLEQEEGRPLLPLQLNDWMRAEGRYLARLIRGSLHWWGLCDLAVSEDGRLLAFRLTPSASALLDGVKTPGQGGVAFLSDPASLLHVRESGEVLITCTSAAWPLIEVMEELAAPCGVYEGQLCYRLTSRSLAEAMTRGRQPTALLALLRRLAENEGDVDGNLARLQEQLERRIANYGRARLYSGVTLLAAADTLVLRELSATTSLEAQVVRALQPTLFIVKKQGAERMMEELKRRGQVPLLHEEEIHGTE